MPWTTSDYPAAVKNLPENVRQKAIEIANALLEDGYEEGRAIAIAISKAKHIDQGNVPYHVIPYDGEWAVRREKAKRVSDICPTKDEAIARAKALANDRKTYLIIHDSNGRIQETLYN